jgi:hypothetical protein
MLHKLLQGIIIVKPLLFKYLPSPPLGMALFPFILLQDETLLRDKYILNHERIHLRQEVELFILPFYVLYLLNYFINLFIYRSHYKAYRNICFEREAYQNDKNLSYLVTRKTWSWVRYL